MVHECELAGDTLWWKSACDVMMAVLVVSAWMLRVDDELLEGVVREWRFLVGLNRDMALSSSSSPKPKRSWEVEPHAWAAAPSLDSELEEEETPASAGEALVELLTSLKYAGTLSAHNVCLIAYWAHRAGACGLVSRLGKAPGAASGAYSAHFDKVIGHRDVERDLYYMDVPAYKKCDATRVLRSIPVFPPHEILDDDVAAGGEGVLEELRRSVAAREWPPAYYNHPVVQQARPRVALPLGLFVDAVEFAHRDAVLGVFLVNMVTGMRHLCAAVRRSTMCRCSCRGWCTLWPILQMLHWSFLSLASGVRPHSRHDARPFGATTDALRAELAGKPLAIVGALVWLKADWGEYVHTLGLTSWSHAIHSCPLCKCTKDQWIRPAGFDALSFPWPLRSFAEYLHDVTICEIRVHVATTHLLNIIRARFFFDKRQGGAKGRALSEGVPEVGLLKGDRLEPDLSMPDVGMVDSISAPCTLLFWRSSAASSSSHRNPLFSEATGITPERCLAVDWLHCLSLGVFQNYLAIVVNMLFASNAWQTAESTAVGVAMVSCQLLSAELEAWYKSDAGRGYTRIQNLAHTMFGSHNAPTCLLKGAETNGFLAFVVGTLLDRHRALEHWSDVKRAGVALLSLHRLIHEHPRVFPPSAVQSFVDNTKRYLKVVEKLKWHTKPKDHQLMHLAHRALEMGSPALYANWVDESLNRHLKGIAAAAHSTVWEARVLAEFRAWKGMGRKRRMDVI